MRIVYLHGFASSPASRKARFFVEKLSAAGLHVDALNLAPDFLNLTISSQLNVIDHAVHGDPVVLIGSSLGGYLAALYAAGHSEVSRLLLLAPAFNFYHLWATEMGPQRLEEWRINGTISVFHYGTGQQAPLSYRMMEDAQKYQGFPDFRQPCLILHGRNDSVVPFSNSARFAETHPNVTLLPFASGHELTDVLDDIWKASSTFLLSADPEI